MAKRKAKESEEQLQFIPGAADVLANSMQRKVPHITALERGMLKTALRNLDRAKKFGFRLSK